jgi:hypothetical protein
MKILILLTVILYLVCNTNESQTIVSGNARVSECGGFSSLAKVTQIPYQKDSVDYCKAELIRWSFDSVSNRLDILHTRIQQDCAAKLEVQVMKTNSIYEIIETNTSKVSADCSCYFDTYCEIADIHDRSISFMVAGKTFIFDLDSLKGSIIVDSTSSGFCR